MATGTATPIAWQQADRDTDNFWSAGAPSKITVPTGVTKVRVGASANIGTGGANTTIRQITLKKNGSVVAGGSAITVTGISSDLTTWSTVLDVAAGDYFEAVYFHNRGSDESLTATAGSWFGIEVVEATP
jgi:hypothetical protein